MTDHHDGGLMLITYFVLALFVMGLLAVGFFIGRVTA